MPLNKKQTQELVEPLAPPAKPEPYQPIIKERDRSGDAYASVYPFDGDKFTYISAYARPYKNEYDEAHYEVLWPSIGAASTELTRQFAAGLIAACDWVDAKQAEHAAKPATENS